MKQTPCEATLQVDRSDAHAAPAHDARQPDFIVVGSQRCGTTWLAVSLAEHPRIGIAVGSTMKEINFFDDEANWAKGPDWYLDHFRFGSETTCVGEVCPDYMFTPVAIERIKALFPQIKIIALLRDPIDRARSAHKTFGKHYTGLGWKEIVTQPDHELIRRGQYYPQLEVVLAHFPRSAVGIYLFEDFARDNGTVLREIYAFLGVDPGFRPSTLNRVINKGLFPRTVRVLRQLGLGALVEFIKGSRLGDMLRARARPLAGHREIDASDEALLENYFRVSNRKVSKLLRREGLWKCD